MGSLEFLVATHLLPLVLSLWVSESLTLSLASSILDLDFTFPVAELSSYRQPSCLGPKTPLHNGSHTHFPNGFWKTHIFFVWLMSGAYVDSNATVKLCYTTFTFWVSGVGIRYKFIMTPYLWGIYIRHSYCPIKTSLHLRQRRKYTLLGLGFYFFLFRA